MKREYCYWLFVLVFLLLPFNASAYQVDQMQTLANHNFSAVHFAPVGQSFIPQQATLLGVTLKLADAGGAGVGNWAKVRLRKSGMDGEIIAVSDERYLEDCFNFIADPGCGLGGGNPAEITFLFAQLPALDIGEVYVIELVVDGFGDGVNAAYYAGDVYSGGGYYKNGVPYADDLWFRTLAPGNTEILVSSNNQLKHFSLDGQLLGTDAIPRNANNEIARDIVQHAIFGTWVFNGTFQPQLSHYRDGVWSMQNFAGWSIANNDSYGGIANDGRFIYATDGSTAQGGAAKGIVRFDMTGQLPAQRFQSQTEYIDITLGLDGNLYALRNTYGDVDVITPATMARLRTVDLGHNSASRAVAASANGAIYMASWDGHLYHYDATGQLLNSVVLGGNLYDLDIHPVHGLLVANRWGNIWLLDWQLQILQSFSGATQGAFAAFSDGALQPEYCIATGQNTAYEWIESIATNGVALPSGDNHGYWLHTAAATPVSMGQPNTLLFTPGFRSGAFSEYWRAWVDFNRDGKFGAEEEVVTTRSNSAVLTTFDVPAATALGVTQMRVAMRFDAPPDNCGHFYYGEVEDFAVNIVE